MSTSKAESVDDLASLLHYFYSNIKFLIFPLVTLVC